MIAWLGHATVVVEHEGTRAITDPLLRKRVAHLVRHVEPAVVGGPVDLVLLSHLHRDHLDLPSLRKLDSGALVVVPPGGAGALHKLGFEVAELEPGDELRRGAIRVVAVPAVHDVRRTPLGPVSDAIGYVIEAGERIYFAGDTERFDGMRELGPLDVALLPIWGWGPTLGPGHMDPEQAAEAVALLRPEVAVPIHWGTYLPLGTRPGDVLREPPRRFAAAVGRLAPDTRVAVLQPGEALA